MAQHNIGSLVVLKPGEEQQIAGIFTERGKTLFCSYNITWPNIHSIYAFQTLLTNLN